MSSENRMHQSGTNHRLIFGRLFTMLSLQGKAVSLLPMEIHWNILDKKRKEVLPLLKKFSEEGFYLAGGTGLALLLGHRDSVDFDFFKKGDYDIEALIEKIKLVFKKHNISITQKEKNTVSCKIDDDIRLSFFTYNYELLSPLIQTEYFSIASVKDIACMKLSAISGRAVEKDYVDLYFIAQKIALKELIDACLKKYPVINQAVILKSLPSVHDVEKENIRFAKGYKVSLEEIKKYFDKSIKEYVRQIELESIRKSKKEKNIDRDR